MSLHPVSPEPRTPPRLALLRSWSNLRVGSDGFSLTELLIGSAVTLIVMALALQVMTIMYSVHRRESRIAEVSSGVVRALDDMLSEIGRAGYGLGDEVESVVFVPGRPLASPQITIRSNPDGIGFPLPHPVKPGGPSLSLPADGRLAPGDLVLLSESTGASEAAVVASNDSGLSLRPYNGDEQAGTAWHKYSRTRGGRLSRLREVRYYLMPDRGETVLVKEIDGQPARVLARSIDELRFEFHDAHGNELAPVRLSRAQGLATVGVRLQFSVGPAPSDRRTLATAVGLQRQSDRIDFAEPGQGFRLTRYFYPIDNPAAVATPPFADWGVILSQGRNPSQDRSYLYTFLTQKRFLEARVENVTVLEEPREPVALAFGPDPGGLFGWLFLVSSGARSGSVARLQLNKDGVLSPESAPKIFEATEELAQARGVAGGVDGALYITTSLKSAIVRYRFDDSGQPMGPEELARLPGRPGAIARGAEGALYFIMDSAVSGADPSDIWKVPFNRSLEPEPPLRIATLSGKGLSLALEPVSGQLFALVRERLGDFVILRLPALWLRTGVGEPETVFSLDKFRRETMDRASGERPKRRKLSPILISVRLPDSLLPQALDFVAFDTLGLMYLGARERNLVLKFDVDGVDIRHAVGVAGVVIPADGTLRLPKVRLHAWKESLAGL